MTTPEELIERLERATEGSRELDQAINLEVFTQIALPEPPPYTSSTDAALTLFPALIAVDIATGTQGANTPSWQWPVISTYCNETGRKLWEGQARTLPIALCIAALKARSAR